jgi:hypothetical protein
MGEDSMKNKIWVVEIASKNDGIYHPRRLYLNRNEARTYVNEARRIWPSCFYRVRCYVPRDK